VGGDPEDVASGSVLFQDDFSDPSSGWDRVTEPDGATDYANGVYRILVSASDLDVWSNPGLSFTDTHIEVDATKIAGDDNNDFGVICRYQDADNFYEMVISSDGYYGIVKIKDGERVPIEQQAMLPSEAIQQGAATNHIRVDCVGSTLALYVGGQQLAEVQDSDFASGDVGLIAGTFDVPGTEIHFDNFTVLKP
jgi:hypothetical protein